MGIWRSALVAFGAASLFFASTGVSAQDYPAGGAQLTVRDSSGTGRFAPGESGEATGTGLTENEGYNLELGQTRIDEGRTNGQGRVTFSFTLPTTAQPGSPTLAARPSDGSGREATAMITIVAQGSDTATASPTATGPGGTGTGTRPTNGSTTQGSSGATDQGSGGLPRSGAGIAIYFLLGLLFVVTGVTLALYARRRALVRQIEQESVGVELIGF